MFYLLLLVSRFRDPQLQRLDLRDDVFALVQSVDLGLHGRLALFQSSQLESVGLESLR
jgi:hypothetical protein